MKQITTEAIPTVEEIRIAQWFADDKSVEWMATEAGIATGKVYERIAIIKTKYGKRSPAGLVALFMRNKLIK